jgi:hypothetical protein
VNPAILKVVMLLVMDKQLKKTIVIESIPSARYCVEASRSFLLAMLEEASRYRSLS